MIDSLDRMKILEQVALLEEPFPPELRAEVSDLPVCLAADESLHDLSEVNERADLGYRAMAIKPAGKDPKQIPADGSGRPGAGNSLFCRRLGLHSPPAGMEQKRSGPPKAVPGLEMGIIESHGEQTYKNWRGLVADLPIPGRRMGRAKGGDILPG